jgi:hypothetical protein
LALCKQNEKYPAIGVSAFGNEERGRREAK